MPRASIDSLERTLCRLKRACTLPGEFYDWTEHTRPSARMSGRSCGRRPVTQLLPPQLLHMSHVLSCVNLQKAAALVQRATPCFVATIQSLGLDSAHGMMSGV